MPSQCSERHNLTRLDHYSCTDRIHKEVALTLSSYQLLAYRGKLSLSNSMMRYFRVNSSVSQARDASGTTMPQDESHIAQSISSMQRFFNFQWVHQAFRHRQAVPSPTELDAASSSEVPSQDGAHLDDNTIESDLDEGTLSFSAYVLFAEYVCFPLVSPQEHHLPTAVDLYDKVRCAALRKYHVREHRKRMLGEVYDEWKYADINRSLRRQTDFAELNREERLGLLDISIRIF